MGIDLCLHFYLHGVNMAGWNTIERIRRLEERIDKLGFKFAKSKHSDWSEDHGALSLRPKDPDALPIYSRDAELFIGSIERLEDWLAGVRWAREYDMMLKLSDEKKRTAAEQKERNRQLMRTLKEGKRVEGVVE
jgi:hypothetical protein